MRKLVLSVPVLVLVATAWFASAALAQQAVTVPLAEQNESGVSGTATLTDLGNSHVQVTIQVTPGGNANMPAHIHTGACPNPGAVIHPLTNVVDGRSTTVVQGSLDQIAASGQAINLHKSPQEIPNYAACGDLLGVAAGGAARAGGLDPTVLVAAFVLLGTLLLVGGGLLLRRPARI